MLLTNNKQAKNEKVNSFFYPSSYSILPFHFRCTLQRALVTECQESKLSPPSILIIVTNHTMQGLMQGNISSRYLFNLGNPKSTQADNRKYPF